MDEPGVKRKTAVVTGSAIGIGAEVAIRFGGEGANIVVIHANSEQQARATTAVADAEAGRPIAVQGDVADDVDCRKIARAALVACTASNRRSLLPPRKAPSTP